MFRFAYLTADGKMAAESYHQAYIYQDFIQRHGIGFDYYPALPGALWGLWRNCCRNDAIVSRILRRLIRIIVIPLWRLLQFLVILLRGYDGFIMGRCLSQPEATPWLEALWGTVARLQRRPFILYLPDAMHLVYSMQYNKRFRACSHVLAVTPWLEANIKSKGLRCFLSRVPVNVDRYPMILHQRRTEIVIGFSGGPDNFPALLEIEDALAIILERYPQTRLLIVSGRPPSFKNHRLRFTMQKWLSNDPYRSAFELGVEEMLNFDIALAPLLSTEYARGKDSAKLRQYMTLGLPVVASNFGVNAEIIEPNVNGFLASNAAAWVAMISSLVEDPDLRGRVGRAARIRVASEFDVNRQAPLLAKNLIGSLELVGHETR